MAWTADGSALLDHATFVRQVNVGASSKRNTNLMFAYMDGEYSPAQKFYTGADVLLEVGVINSDDNTYYHLSQLQKMLGKSSGLVTLTQTDHVSAGTVSADVELLSDPRPTQDRFTYIFPLRNPEGSWYGGVNTAFGTTPSITTGGDRPINDMIITFSAAGTASHVHAFGTSSLEWAGSGTAIVDVGAKTVVQGSSYVDADFVPSDPWWWRFAEASSISVSSSVSITVNWRNRFA